MLSTKFSFQPIIPKRFTRSQDPNLIVGRGVCSISGAFFAKYGEKFRKVRALWDDEAKVVGLHFHNSSNRVADSFALRAINGSATRAFSSKTLRDRVHQNCGEGVFVGRIEPAFDEGPDFFIVRLKREDDE